jgi:hypothetical protein
MTRLGRRIGDGRALSTPPSKAEVALGWSASVYEGGLVPTPCSEARSRTAVADSDLLRTVLYWQEALLWHRGRFGGLERSYGGGSRCSHFVLGNGVGLTSGVMSHHYFTLVRKDSESATARSRSDGDGEVGNILF